MAYIKNSRAYKYAKACAADTSGKVGRYVKKQCEQWLEIADGNVSGCFVSGREYDRISKLLKVMVHPDLRINMHDALEDYAMLFIIAVLCTLRDNGAEKPTRKYSIGVLEIARKNFKTFTSAVIFIILLLTEPEFARLFSVAPDYKLSSELRLAVRKIVRCSPLLDKHFKVNRDRVVCDITDSEYTPLAYSNDRLDGKLANAFLADEDGGMDAYPVEAMTSSQINLKNKLGIIISTRYPNDNNDFDERVKFCKQIIDGVQDFDNYFALLYEPDDEIIKEWQTNDNVLLQANPAALDKPEMIKNLLEKRTMAIMFDNQKENFLCKHCNISYKGLGTEGYVSIDKVQKCRIERDDSFWYGRNVYLGFDLSQTEDNTAVAMVTYDRSTGIIYSRVMGFIPGDRIQEKSDKERFNYQRSVNMGECTACGGDVIDYSMVEHYIMTLEARLGVRVLYAAYDRWNALSTVQKLESADDPIQCIEVMQHSKVLHPATKLLKEKILNGEFRYEENYLLENNFTNARCTEDTNLNKYVNKKRSSGKVDMVVALINAVYLVNEYEIIGMNEIGCTIIECN